MQDSNLPSGSYFERPKHSGAPQGFSLELTPKKIFGAGVIVGVMTMLSAGFIFQLSTGGTFSALFAQAAGQKAGAKAAAPSAAPSPTAPAANDQPTVGPVAPVTSSDHIRGDKNAPVTLVEYSDFECPFCKRFDPTLQQIMQDYKGKVRWVYRQFPLTSIHQDAEKAAEASECASEQGKFWEMADALFAGSPTLDAASLQKYAQTAGVSDMNKFNDCLSSGKMAQKVAAQQKSGNDAGVSGTPATIVIGKGGKQQLIPGALPIDAVKQVIDAMLK